MALFAVKIVGYRTFLLLYCYVLSFDNVATEEENCRPMKLFLSPGRTIKVSYIVFYKYVLVIFLGRISIGCFIFSSRAFLPLTKIRKSENEGKNT